MSDSITVTITLSLNEAEQISNGLADLLCWIRGFEAAIPEDIDRHPMGAEAVRRIRLKLNSEVQRRAHGAQSSRAG